MKLNSSTRSQRDHAAAVRREAERIRQQEREQTDALLAAVSAAWGMTPAPHAETPPAAPPPRSP